VKPQPKKGEPALRQRRGPKQKPDDSGSEKTLDLGLEEAGQRGEREGGATTAVWGPGGAALARSSSTDRRGGQKQTTMWCGMDLKEEGRGD
jgi:hypothetical protein